MGVKSHKRSTTIFWEHGQEAKVRWFCSKLLMGWRLHNWSFESVDLVNYLRCLLPLAEKVVTNLRLHHRLLSRFCSWR
jgi:hypothetical protein